MLLFKSLAHTGDKPHCGAIKAFSCFQRPTTHFQGHSAPVCSLCRAGRELFVYLGTCLWGHIMGQTLEGFVDSGAQLPCLKGSSRRRGPGRPGEVRGWFCRRLPRGRGL